MLTTPWTAALIPIDRGQLPEKSYSPRHFPEEPKDLVIVRVAHQIGERLDLVRFLTMVLRAIES